jgi:site-specific DNA recombinase
VCGTCDSLNERDLVKNRNVHYYRCNTVGCGNNKNANPLNVAFLKPSAMDYEKDLIKRQTIDLYNQFKED